MTGRGNPSSDRQVSDLRPPMTTSESAPDPTAGERMCDCHNPPQRLRSHDDYPATPDADDASEPLTEAEVDTLADAFVAANRAEFMDTDFDLPIQQAVERIKAAAATKARAELAALVRDDIRARRREFKRLGADEQYLSALDDAFGLAANRARGDA